MKILEIIQEARKNPRLNPKTSINQILVDRLNATQDEIAGVKNLFVSFTEIDKLGINPQSKYNTPLGIYSYPAQYVYNTVNLNNPMKYLPFAGESPYVNIFSVKGNIIDINNMKYSDFTEYRLKFENLFTHYGIDLEELTDILDSAQYESYVNSAGGKFWFITMRIAVLLTKTPSWNSKNSSVSWTKLFKILGIDGVVDTGTGIIHPQEPSQAVFFNMKAIVNNQRYYNKYSPKYVKTKTQFGQTQIQLKQQVNQEVKNILSHENNENQLLDFVNDPDTFKNVKLSLIPKNVLTDLLKRNPSLINHKDQVPYEIQNFLIQQDPSNIQYIKNPPASIQMMAIKKDASNIQYIKNPPASIQAIAVKHGAFKYIKNPSEYVKLLAIKKDIQNFQYIKHITKEIKSILNQQPENIQMDLISNNAELIRSIENPSIPLQITAIRKSSGNIVPYVDFSLEKIQIELINKDIEQIEFFTTKPYIIISDKVMELLKNKYEQTPDNEKSSLLNKVKFLINVVSTEEQVNAVKWSPDFLFHIRHFSENFIKEIIKQYPAAFFDYFLIHISKAGISAEVLNQTTRVVSNLPETEQLQLIKTIPRVIRYIKNPSTSVIMFIINKFPDYANNINNLPDQIIVDLAEKNTDYIKNMGNIPLSAQLALIEKNPIHILYIRNPENETQLEAIKKLYTRMLVLREWIKKPTDEAKELWLKLRSQNNTK